MEGEKSKAAGNQKFTMKVFHTRKHLTKKVIKSLAAQHKLSIMQVQETKAGRVIRLMFKSKEDQEKASKVFNGLSYRGGQLYVKGYGEDLKRENDSDNEANKRQKVELPKEEEEEKNKDIRDVVTPYWKMSYEAQLKEKRKALIAAMRKLTKRILQTALATVRDQLRNRGIKNATRKEMLEELPKWLSRVNTSVPFTSIDELIESPVKTGYRNKCTFTCGFDEEGKQCVGFREGSFHDTVRVKSPSSVAIVPPEAKIISERMTTFLREESSLPPYNMKEHTGVWRVVTVRVDCDSSWRPPADDAKPSSYQRCLVMVLVDAEKVESSVFEEEKAKLLKALNDSSDGAELTLNVMIHSTDNLSVPSSGDVKWEVLQGEPRLYGKLCGLTFDISPDAFFQVNAPATELLYNKVKEWVLLPEAEATAPVSRARFGRWIRHPGDTLEDVKSYDLDEEQTMDEEGTEEDGGEGKDEATAESSKPSEDQDVGVGVLDLCCGTGTIGLCLAKDVDYVIGVEMIPSAVEDAKRTAEKLNITNADFIAGRAEHVSQTAVNQLIERVKEAKWGNPKAEGPVRIVAVVDPPRPGLHAEVVKTLRHTDLIDRLVYVSCNPTKTFIDDAVRLCHPPMAKSGVKTGSPFSMQRATGVDLFPHTEHVELVSLFTR